MQLKKIILWLLIVSSMNIVIAAPITSFSGSPTSGDAPLSVQFTDTSSNSPAGWAWFFGDEDWAYPAWELVTDQSGLPGKLGARTVSLPNGHIVLTGGSSSAHDNDVWRSTDMGKTWNQINSSAGWMNRTEHATVVLSDGSIVLLGGIGGISGGTLLNDVWRSTDEGETWNEMSSASPWMERAQPCLVALPDNSIVLIGGQSYHGSLSDVWRSTDTGVTWELMNDSPGWTGRTKAGCVVMPDGSMVLMGGSNVENPMSPEEPPIIHLLNDTWRSSDNGAHWTLMNANSGWAAGNGFCSMAMPDGSIILLEVVDLTGAPYLWRSCDNGATWSKFGTIPSRYDMNSVVMQDGSVVIIGGHEFYDGMTHFYNDILRFSPAGSSSQNPLHTYSTPGVYPVTLQSYNADGYQAITHNAYINVTGTEQPPIASFTVNKTSGPALLTVKFTDTSTGGVPTAWNWSFGDYWFNTTNIHERDVIKTYLAGTYNAQLLVSNSAGTSLSSPVTITVSESVTPTITSISPNVIPNIGVMNLTRITGTGFVSGGTVNKIQLGDASGHTYNSTVFSLGSDNSIVDIQFNLVNAPAGSYYVRVSKDGGLTWTSSSSPILKIQNQIVSETYSFRARYNMHHRTITDNLNPMGVAVDEAKNIFVADIYAGSVFKYDTNGNELLQIGSPGTADDQMRMPCGVAVDSSGNIFVANLANSVIQKFNANGIFQYKIGSSGTGDGQFQGPLDIAVDTSDCFYVVDNGNARVQKFDSDGHHLFTLGSRGDDDGQFLAPNAIAIDESGNIYVADTQRGDVQKFNVAGEYVSKYVIPESFGHLPMELPIEVATDKSGNLYVSSSQGYIKKFNSKGQIVSTIGAAGTGNGQFSYPGGVAIDASGYIVVADSTNYNIQKFSSTQSIIPFITGITPDSVVTGTNPAVISAITGEGFASNGAVNSIQLDDGSGHLFNHTTLGTITDIKISGTKFNLIGAPLGSYYLKVSKNSGVTWITSVVPLLNITTSDPSILSITPNTGPNTASLTSSIVGTNFRTGASVILSNRTLTLLGVNPVITSNKITCSFPLTGAPPLVWNLTVRNTDGTNATLPAAFTVTNSSPTITAVTPSTGFNTTNTNLTITGSSFRNGITAQLVCDNHSLPGTDLVKTDTTKLQYTFGTLGKPAGKYNLTLTNIDGSSVMKTSAFELKPPSDSPVITATTPFSGANNAAKAIVITGSNFRGPKAKTFTGITVTLTNSTYGTTITGSPTSKKTQSATTLYYTLPLTGQPAGIYDLTVRNYDGSTVTNTSGFIITTTDPTVTKISPASGYTTKDQVVILTGTNFRTGAVVTIANGLISYNGSGVTVTSPTTLTSTLGLLTDSVQPGRYNLTVTNTDGAFGTLANAFTVIAPVNSPVISSITPAYGTNNIALPVTIRGSNFSKPAVTITNGTASFAAAATKNKKQSATVLYYTLPLKGLESGDYQVKVTNADGTYATVPFAVNPTTPTITAISPVLGYTTGNTAVTITGTNYREGATVVLANGSDSYPAEDTVVTVSKITCTVPTTGMSARKYNLTVTNTDGTNATKPDFFTVYNPGNNPMIDGISPNVSSNAESKAVTIYGAEFRGTKANSFDGIAVTLSNTTTSTTVTGTPTPKKAHSATRLYYTLPFSGVPAGVYDLKVVNADGQVATQSKAFTVTTTNPTIAIDAKTKKEKISPVTAFNTGTVSVTITGNNFREGVAVRLANGTEEIQGTVTTRLINQVITTFPLNGKDAGSYNLTITNTDGTSVTAKTKFSVTNPGTAAVISSVSPASAFNTGNQPVVISGKNFNKPTVYLNQGELTLLAIATAKKKSTATTLYVTFPLKDIPGGLYSIIVRNSDGVNTTATDIFYVTEKAWVNSVQKSPVVQSNPRMPVMSLPQVSRPTGTQATVVGPQIINSPVVVPPVPVTFHTP